MNGLATTSISCKKYNRKYIGFEISKEYYEESLKRIEEWKDDNVKPNSLSEKEIEEVMLEADTILHRLNND
jgi:DNA modification methylase